MSIETDLIQHLENDTALADIVGGNIHPLVSGGEFPCLVYTAISDSDQQSLQGETSFNKIWFQIDCYAKSYKQVKELRDALKDALYSFNHIPYDFVSRDRKEDKEKLYRQIVEFKLNY